MPKNLSISKIAGISSKKMRNKSKIEDLSVKILAEDAEQPNQLPTDFMYAYPIKYWRTDPNRYLLDWLSTFEDELFCQDENLTLALKFSNAEQWQATGVDAHSNIFMHLCKVAEYVYSNQSNLMTVRRGSDTVKPCKPDKIIA